MVDDRCEISDLPRDQCAHCGARPGDRIHIAPPLLAAGGAPTSVFDTAALPSSWATRTDPPKLHLRYREQGCACGSPTRDDAFACDDCAGELTRFLADAPWYAEQLDVTITGQRGKRPTSGSGRSDALPFNDKAASVQRALKTHLISTARVCIRTHVRHQSPHIGPPRNSVESVSKWLLWRVDGLMFSTAFTNILRDSLAIERKAVSVIDRVPDRQFLGMCELAKLKLCDGAVYVKAGELIGKCRECGMKYDAEDRRKSLEKALDDQLVTAADIARLSTYLGLPASREAIRKTVNRWHSRKVLIAKKFDPDGTPRFRYGDVAPLLSIAYDRKADG